MSEENYVVVGCKKWNRRIFGDSISRLPGHWSFVGSRSELTVDLLTSLHPRYVFFLHWSWIVPPEIVDQFECVCFHMADVPYGRGGSPLQNLIVRGHRETNLAALRMVRELDAGPVYMKEPMSLEGGAEEILIRANRLSAKMIARIIADHPEPRPQRGKTVLFTRRKPSDSEVPAIPSIEALHDHIRMLDADGYPPAFIVHHGFVYRFTRPALYDGCIVADVKITRLEKD